MKMDHHFTNIYECVRASRETQSFPQVLSCFSTQEPCFQQVEPRNKHYVHLCSLLVYFIYCFHLWFLILTLLITDRVGLNLQPC